MDGRWKMQQSLLPLIPHAREVRTVHRQTNTSLDTTLAARPAGHQPQRRAAAQRNATQAPNGIHSTPPHGAAHTIRQARRRASPRGEEVVDGRPFQVRSPVQRQALLLVVAGGHGTARQSRPVHSSCK